MSRGFYPSGGGAGMLHGPGKVKDDDGKTYDPSNSYSYKACPESVNELESKIDQDGDTGETYDISNSNGGKNCVGWACQKMEDAGFTAPFSPDTFGLAPKFLPGRGYGPGRRPQVE